MNNKGNKNPNYKDGHTMIQHYCIDCGDRIGYQAIRCRKCADRQHSKRISGKDNPNFDNPRNMKGETASNYKDGRKSKTYYCKESDCNNEITYENWKHGNERCQSCAKIGKLNYNWKNGITSLNILIRSLKEYRDWRKIIFERDSYTCQECGDNKGHNLNAHHKKPFTELLNEFLKEYDQFSPIEDKETLVRLAMKWQPFWNIDNGETLCEDCHKLTRKNKEK